MYLEQKHNILISSCNPFDYICMGILTNKDLFEVRPLTDAEKEIARNLGLIVL